MTGRLAGVLTVVLVGVAGAAAGQGRDEVPATTYARAEQLLPWNVTALARNTEPMPRWIAGEPESFWYRRDTDDGWAYRIVDAGSGDGAPAFDHARLAAALAPQRVDVDHLEVLDITASAGERRVSVRTQTGVRVCSLASYRCVAPDPATIPGGASVDGLRRLTRREGRIAVATPDHSAPLSLDLPPLAADASAHALWAPGGGAAVLEVVDRAPVTRAPLVAWVDDGGRPAPRLIPFAGGTRASPEAPVLRFFVVSPAGSAGSGWRVVPIDLEGVSWSSAIDSGQVSWSRDGSRLFILLAARDGTRLSLWRIDPTTGSAERVIDEESEEGLSWNVNWAGGLGVRIDAGGDRVVWFSERDGWGHLWLYSLDDPGPPRQLTRGPFVVRDLLWMSEDATDLLVTVAGLDTPDDPYHRRLAHVDVGTGVLTPLTSAAADHAATVSPSGRYFVDVASSLDGETTMTLHRADGSRIALAERSDLSRLTATGWSSPLRERIPLDGVQGDVFATVLRPSHFDPSRRYPVVECLYPLPDGAWAPVRLGDALLDRFTQAQAVAELGFIAVFIDAPGSGLRSRAFGAGARGNLHAVGLAARVRALRVLATRHPQMDLSRTGVYGNSGGGNAAVRALLERPDVYHVAVASGGNHDLRFGGPWVERHQGLAPGPPERESNLPLADRLSGELLLAHGALDRVVHAGQTLALAQAFIEADRDVDVLLLPDRGHDVLNDPYFLRRMWDHLVEHLQNRRPPLYRIAPPPEWVR